LARPAHRSLSALALIPRARRLTTLGAVEDDPDGEVVAEVLESMLGSRGHEHEVSGSELVPLAVVEQDASSADDHVDLVLRVRRLLVGPHRAGQLDLERPAIHQADGMLSRGTGDSRPSVRETDHAAAI